LAQTSFPGWTPTHRVLELISTGQSPLSVHVVTDGQMGRVARTRLSSYTGRNPTPDWLQNAVTA